MRAALYARYSTERQRETSIADQLRVSTARAELERWTVVAEHSDDAVSGTLPVAARRGGAALLADAMAGRFDVLLLEGLDRLARDLVEQETIVRRLEHRGIRLIGVADGYDSQSSARKLHRGMRGIINEIYIDDLRSKTHRGLAGQVGRGFSAGGVSFGYRSVAVEGGHLMEIDTAAAAWVVRIFELYAEGWSCQRIAAELNRLRVPSPRGGTWAVSAIYGSPAKGAGILNNELYIGRYIWNRSQWVSDPDSRRRQRLDRPRSEWQVIERPDLRIVPDHLWQAARARIDRPGRQGGQRGRGARPRTLFGGLLRCGCCGGAVVAVSTSTYGCAARKDRGPSVCPGVRISRRVAERRLLTEIRESLSAPEAIAEFRAELERAAAAHLATANEGAGAARKRIIELDREIGRLVDAIAAVGISDALRERLQSAEAERATLRQRTTTPAARPIDIEAAVRAYREKLVDLGRALDHQAEAAREHIAQLIPTVTLTPGPAGEVFATLETEPAALMAAGGDWIGSGDSRSGCGGPLWSKNRTFRLA